jgi:four helix bundle protein
MPSVSPDAGFFTLSCWHVCSVALTVMAVAKRFEDLVVWQRMHELSTEIWKATNRLRDGDARFRDQIRGASDSAASNVAEGFGRFSPRQFAHFLDVARGSAQETRSLLRKGLAIGYWPVEEYERLDALAIRAIQATARL